MSFLFQYRQWHHLSLSMDFFECASDGSVAYHANYFNLFVIFFDGLIVMVLFDRDRSKYMMLVKKT